MISYVASVLVSRPSGLGSCSGSGWGHWIVFLDKTLKSHSASTQVYENGYW